MFYSTQHNIQILKVTYGNKTITDRAILDRLRHDLSERQDAFKVTNGDLGGDPQEGVHKTCTVDYRDHPDHPHCRISAGEGEFFLFSCRVSGVKYGDVDLRDKPEVFERLNRATREYARARHADKFFGDKNEGRIKISNDTMGGDPRYGVEKQAEVEVLSRSDFEYFTETYDEDEWFPKTQHVEWSYWDKD